MKKCCFLLALCMATASFTACDESNSEDSDAIMMAVFPEQEDLSEYVPGQPTEFSAGFDKPLSAPTSITVTSSNPDRAAVSFERGSFQVYPSGGVPTFQTATATCLTTESEAPQIVTITFTVSNSVDDIAPMRISRQIVCPGKDGNTEGVTPLPPVPEKAGVLVNPQTGLITAEDGQTATFSVVLSKKPADDVSITAKSFNAKEGIVTPDSVTFTPKTWNIPQNFTITGQDDNAKDGDIAYSILVGPAVSKDPAYNGLTISSVSVTNLDNDRYSDSGDITVAPTSLEVTEGGSATFHVKLAAEPMDPVTISFKTQNEKVLVSPSLVTIDPASFMQYKTITVTAKRDGVESAAPLTDAISMTVTSTDTRFHGLELNAIPVSIRDTEAGKDEKLTFRAMAANITSGDHQSYTPGHGIRIFQAAKPDVVMIQEFNYNRDTDNDIRNMVNEAFGSEFHYSRGRAYDGGWIPNGIISRFPIIDSGYWESNKIKNRDWNWALLDIPGKKELLVISVHLSTSENSSEIPSLASKIKKKIAEDKDLGLEYYLLIGGDFNSSRAATKKNDLSDTFVTNLNNRMPVDQKSNDATSAKRSKVLDLLFADKELHYKEVPVEIGTHSYKYGHVFDSRVYSAMNELGDVPPVRRDDSGASNMQHMAVIREFSIVGK